MLAPVIHIHRTPMVEVTRELDREAWCFHERRRTRHLAILTRTAEPSYYDPQWHIECESCGEVDADVFPGCSREWSGY